MDVSDINKVANRKRMNADAEKLREKVSRETAKIIKLKVAQDTAYWDAREKLAQTERSHERLRQNMLEVQMQLEAASAQHQHELRMRPDTLNRLAAARDTCAVLEDYGERLRAGVARVHADHAALGEAYDAAARRVRDGAAAAELRARGRDALHRERQRAAAARLRRVEAEAAGARRAAAEAREALAAAGARADGLAARLDDAAQRAQRRDRELAALREEASRLRGECAARGDRVRDAIAARERDATAALEARAALEAELSAQRERASGARREAELARERADAVDAERRALHQTLQEARSTIERLNGELVVSGDARKALDEAVADASQRARAAADDADRLRRQLDEAEAGRRRLQDELREAERRGAAAAAEAEEAARAAAGLERRVAEGERSLETQRAAQAALRAELAEAAEGVARLMAELRAEGDARARADAAAAATRRQADAERDAAAEKVAAKEKELAAQMNLILEMRAEKERLQERICGMQSTIDNIQHELTGRRAAPLAPPERPHEASAPPAEAAAADDVLYDFLSDGSVDGIDVAEVNRRFEALARGELAPQRLSLSQMKKDLKIKGRTFFKNKRLHAMLTKNK